MSASIEDLERRIARLERVAWPMLVAIGVSAIALVLMAATGPGAVRATAFQLISADGSVRGELVMHDDQPVFRLKDENGIDRIALFHRADASGLYVSDPEGVTRIGVAQFSHGGGGVALHGPDSKGAAVLYLKNTGSLRFFDKTGAVTNEVSGMRVQDLTEKNASPEE